jgi:hypothetical protein
MLAPGIVSPETKILYLRFRLPSLAPCLAASLALQPMGN